jgi:hypothetical protein
LDADDESIHAEDDTSEVLARFKAHYAAPVEENRRRSHRLKPMGPATAPR